MKKTYSLFFIFLIFPLFVCSQTLDEKLKDIDAYANTVMARSISLITISGFMN